MSVAAWPGTDPTRQLAHVRGRMTELEAEASRERMARAAAAQASAAGPRLRLGRWLVRLGQALTADPASAAPRPARAASDRPGR